MLRYVFHAQIKKGEFRGFAAAFEQWDELRRRNGCVPTKLFLPFLGRVNSVQLVSDHESLAAYEADSDREAAASEVMAALRAMRDFVDPVFGAHDELWEQHGD